MNVKRADTAIRWPRRMMAALIVLALAVGCGGTEPEPKKEPPPDTVKTTDTTAMEATLKDTLTPDKLPQDLYFSVKVKDYGTLKVKFHTQEAPKNVTNVANLAIKGFYDGLTFHRIIPNFVVQGGDPKGDGSGGPGYTVEAEIKKPHNKGSLAMARTGDQYNPERRSSGSQFYFCLQPLPQLDKGGYTVIGDLVSGEDVLDKLGQVKTGPMDRPVEPVVMESATVTTE